MRGRGGRVARRAGSTTHRERRAVGARARLRRRGGGVASATRRVLLALLALGAARPGVRRHILGRADGGTDARASPTSARPRPRARGRIPAGRPARVRRWSSFARNDERAVGCARRSRTSEARARSRASPGRERKSCRPAVREASRSGPPRARAEPVRRRGVERKKKESGIFKPSTEGSRPKNHNLPCCQVSAPRTTPLRSATRFFQHSFRSRACAIVRRSTRGGGARGPRSRALSEASPRARAETGADTRSARFVRGRSRVRVDEAPSPDFPPRRLPDQRPGPKRRFPPPDARGAPG